MRWVIPRITHQFSCKGNFWFQNIRIEHSFSCSSLWWIWVFFLLILFGFVSAQAIKWVGCVLAFSFWKAVIKSLLKTVTTENWFSPIVIWFNLQNCHIVLRGSVQAAVCWKGILVWKCRCEWVRVCGGARSCEDARLVPGSIFASVCLVTVTVSIHK